MRTNSLHMIMLEKILVDIVADKLISAAFSKSDIPDIYELAKDRYRIDGVRMLRYAKRRNRVDEVKKHMESIE